MKKYAISKIYCELLAEIESPGEKILKAKSRYIHRK